VKDRSGAAKPCSSSLFGQWATAEGPAIELGRTPKELPGQSDRHLRPRCSRWWSWDSIAGDVERLGPEPFSHLARQRWQRSDALWTFLEHPGVEPPTRRRKGPTQSVDSSAQNQSRCPGDQRAPSAAKAILLTVTTICASKRPYVWQFLGAGLGLPDHRWRT